MCFGCIYPSFRACRSYLASNYPFFHLFLFSPPIRIGCVCVSILLSYIQPVSVSCYLSISFSAFLFLCARYPPSLITHTQSPNIRNLVWRLSNLLVAEVVCIHTDVLQLCSSQTCRPSAHADVHVKQGACQSVWVHHRAGADRRKTGLRSLPDFMSSPSTSSLSIRSLSGQEARTSSGYMLACSVNSPLSRNTLKQSPPIKPQLVSIHIEVRFPSTAVYASTMAAIRPSPALPCRARR